MSELSARSGVAVPTIKYYLRERLLWPGRSTSATRAEYDETHVHRLRLVRALIEVGGLSVATTRDVLDKADDDSVPIYRRLCAVTDDLPPTVEVPDDDSGVDDAMRRLEAVLDRLGWLNWPHARVECLPAMQVAARTIAAMARVGARPGDADLLRYARAAMRVATGDVTAVTKLPPEEAIRHAVVWTVLFEPMLLALRRIAHIVESARLFGTEDSMPDVAGR